MKYTSGQNINRIKWDVLVASSTNPRIYMLSWYLDQTCPSWSAMIWGDYEAAIPLNIKTFFFLKYLPPPLLSQQTGIIFNHGFNYSEALNKFFSGKLFKNLIRFKCNFHAGVNFRHIVLGKQAKLEVRKNYILDLNTSFDSLFQKFNDNRKRNLKKANSLGWHSKESLNFDSAIEMYRDNQALKQSDLKGTYGILTAVYKECLKREMCELYVCEDNNGSANAYCFFARFGKRVYYLFGTTNEIGKKHSAMSVIFQAVIKKYAASDLILDFEGGNLEGIGSYFASFGAVPEEYYSVTKNLF